MLVTHCTVPVVILKSRISAGKAGDMTVWLSSAMNEPTTITPTMMNRACESIGFTELAADPNSAVFCEVTAFPSVGNGMCGRSGPMLVSRREDTDESGVKEKPPSVPHSYTANDSRLCVS